MICDSGEVLVDDACLPSLTYEDLISGNAKCIQWIIATKERVISDKERVRYSEEIKEHSIHANSRLLQGDRQDPH